MPQPKWKTVVRALAFLACGSILLASGCSSPDKANITVRKQKQELEAKLADLQRQHEGDLATIRALEAKATTVPVLPNDRTEKLFTTHGLTFGRLTTGADLN